MSKSSNYHEGRKRDHCYFCDAYGGITEHHVKPQRFDGPDTPENIVGLCARCHRRLERLYDKDFYEFFGIEDEAGKRLFHLVCEHHDCTENVQVKWRYRNIVKRTCFDCAVDFLDRHENRRGRRNPQKWLATQTIAVSDDLPEPVTSMLRGD